MIPVNEPLLAGRELEYVTECVRTGWISSAGRFIDAFESEWASYCGADHGVAVANGTVALEIAVRAAGIGPGDEVILPTFTIVSCASAIVAAGATPVLVDSDPMTLCLDVAAVASRITARTKAIMPVHMYGHPADMDALMALAAKHGLVIIEDAAEAHGAEYLSGRNTASPIWKRCGGIGTIATFSFYANKLITTGEGGMIVTSDRALAERCRSLRNLCFRPERRFYHTEISSNGRLTNLQAALGLAQVERIRETVARKREIAQRYTDALAGVPYAALPTEREWARSVFWMYGLQLAPDCPFDAVEFAARLRGMGVDTRPYFLGMHEQPGFHDMGLFRGERYPVAELASQRGLYLPSGVALTDGQIAEVAAAVRRVLGERSVAAS